MADWTFLPGGIEQGWEENLGDDPRLSLFAAMIANQVAHAGAGIHGVLDARQTRCPVCTAPGFNSGMGVFIHACGAQYHGDGEVSEPCPKADS